METVLTKILQDKYDHIKRAKQAKPLSALEAEVKVQDAPRGFIKALQAQYDKIYDDPINVPFALIAELKKASPSKGLIREDFDPIKLAKAYQEGGATCLSILTDIPYFQGQDSYLQMVRETVNLPILRKDFMIDPYQIIESRALGADCILLIMAALDIKQAMELEKTAHQLGMDVLIEVHNKQELLRALQLNSILIGVNNRNLKNLEVSLENGLQLLPDILAHNKFAVAESGLYKREDLEIMAHAGAKAFLIGESLMRADDVVNATYHLIN